MIPRKNFAQPAIFCPAGRPDRFFLRYICSECLGQRSKMEKSRKYGKRLGPRPRRSRFRRAVILPVCPARKKGTFPRNVSDKSPKNHFRRLYGCESGGAKWPSARPTFFRPAEVQQKGTFARNVSDKSPKLRSQRRSFGQKWTWTWEKFPINFREYGCRLRTRAASYGLGPGHLPARLPGQQKRYIRSE
jgi:hypothetical protein